MRTATKMIFAAAALSGAGLAATPASARTFVSIGVGAPLYRPAYYPNYYPGYYPGYYAPPVVYGGWYGGYHRYWGPRYRGYYGRGYYGRHWR